MENYHSPDITMSDLNLTKLAVDYAAATSAKGIDRINKLRAIADAIFKSRDGDATRKMIGYYKNARQIPVLDVENLVSVYVQIREARATQTEVKKPAVVRSEILQRIIKASDIQRKAEQPRAIIKNQPTRLAPISKRPAEKIEPKFAKQPPQDALKIIKKVQSALRKIGKEEEDEPKIEINKNLRATKQNQLIIAYNNAKGRAKYAAFVSIMQQTAAAIRQFIPSAKSCFEYVKWAATDVLTKINMDDDQFVVSMQFIARTERFDDKDSMINAFRNWLFTQALVYVDTRGAQKDFVFTTRPIELSGISPEAPAVSRELLDAIFSITGSRREYINTTASFSSLPRLYGTVDWRLLSNEIAINPAFAKSNGPTGKMYFANGKQMLIRADANSIQRQIKSNDRAKDIYFGAIAGKALMATVGGVHNFAFEYYDHSFHCDMIFGAGSIPQYRQIPAPVNWNDLTTIQMRDEEYAQFYHEFLDYKYCDDANSPYHGKYVPAEHPSLEFMTSPKYIPNACVLSTFISAMETYKNARGTDPYEVLIEHAGIVPIDKKNHRHAKAYLAKVRLSAAPEIPINFEQLEKICNALRVYARVYTSDGIFLQGCGESDPKKQATHYRSSYNFIYSNGHLYYCSGNKVNSIAAKWGTKRQPTLIPHMPDGIYHCNKMDPKATDPAQVTEYDDIPHVISMAGKWKGIGIVKSDIDLLDLFREIRKTGLTILPKFHGDNLNAIYGKHVVDGKQVKFSFISNISERGVRISNPIEYVRYAGLLADLCNTVLTHRNRSDYTPQTKPIFKCFSSPFSGRLCVLHDDFGSKKRRDALPPVEHAHIDCSKHYTTEAMRIPEFPVYGVFDEPKSYKNPVPASDLDLKPSTLYRISVPEDAFEYLANAAALGRDFIEPGKYLAGYNLERLMRLARRPIMVLGEFTPHRVSANPLPEFFDDETFDAPLKRAANETWGRLGTHEQSTENTLLYNNAGEANTALNAIKEVTCQTKSGVRCKVTPFNICEDAIVVHVRTDKVECANGFLPIKKCIYDGSRIKAMEMCAMMLAFNIVPTAVNTDAVYYDPVANNASNLIQALDDEGNLGPNPGQYNTSKTLTNIRRFDIISGVTPYIPGPERTLLPIETVYDKWDDLLDHTKRILIHGKYPGVGKSYVSFELAKKLCLNENSEKIGHCVFVSPYNEHLLDNFEKYDLFGECRTAASFFGMYITPSGTLACHDEAKDITVPENTKIVIFDEIYLNNMATLTQIYKFILGHPDMVFIANGDYTGQMRAIEHYSDKDAIEKAVKIIFEGSIELNLTVIQRNKCAKYEEFIIRLRSTATMTEEQRLAELLQIIVDFDIKTVSDPRCIPMFDRAIAWRNETKLALNQMKASQIVAGVKIRCHNMFKINAFGGEERDIKTDNVFRPKLKSVDFRKGDAFLVLSTPPVYKDDALIELTPIDGTEKKTKHSIIAIPLHYLTHFGVQFAKTAHGYQGATINGKVFICDIFTEHALKPAAYNYVALTRNTDLADIVIYTGEAALGLRRSKHANGEILKQRQICTSCLRVMRGGEACLAEKSTICVYCERLNNAQKDEQTENVIEQV